MYNKVTKEQLTKEFFAFKMAKDPNTYKLIVRLEKYLLKEPDAELTLFLYVLRTFQADNDQQEFVNCCAIASPIFEHLENTTDWGYTEFYILSMMIGYHSDYGKTRELFQEAMDVLNDGEYTDDPKFKSLCTIMNFNLTLRMLRAKYIDSGVDKDELESSFMRSYKHVIDVCVPKNIPLQYALQTRRGIFENNLKFVEDGLSKLSELGEKKLYKTTKDEIAEYLVFMDEELSKRLSNFVLGYQVRKRRTELNMTTLDLATALNTDQPSVNAIERGDDGVSVDRLKKLCRILSVGAGYFFGDDTKKDESADPFIHAIRACMNGTTDSDKTFVVNLINFLLDEKYPDRGKRGSKSAKSEALPKPD